MRGARPSAAVAAVPSALSIYLSVTKIKEADNIPEAVTDWLKEQEKYMTVAYHPEALRASIKAADKKKKVFDIDTLDRGFSKNLPRIDNIAFTENGKGGNFTINSIELSNGENLPADNAPPWILKKATKMIEEHLKEKLEAAQNWNCLLTKHSNVCYISNVGNLG